LEKANPWFERGSNQNADEKNKKLRLKNIVNKKQFEIKELRLYFKTSD
jgi:hypothetical protein